jgi:hypothetical protein
MVELYLHSPHTYSLRGASLIKHRNKFVLPLLQKCSFVGCVCSTNFYRLFYPSSTHVGASSQFLLCNFWLSPAELTWSQTIK